ncbi:hypothetical protein K2173_028357 [Erythroxylum novogranatense]|uniref:Uncharacterized protein n=1 Tax=Erythroxylum novogranatense TaxID=1862640 RepID=A0AAV8U4B2_9ROSI|nr:hypothetical protein K2173_028357 [Erythroxylum novogranatense]
MSTAPTIQPRKTFSEEHYRSCNPPHKHEASQELSNKMGTKRRRQRSCTRRRKPHKKSSSSKGDGNNSDEEEIPEEIFYRMIRRILVAVGVPMGLGLALLYVFGVVREQNLWEVPMWLPFSTTFITFGASLFGIVYGALSTSLDPNNKGSVLGLEEAQKHWDEMWEEEKTRE